LTVPTPRRTPGDDPRVLESTREVERFVISRVISGGLEEGRRSETEPQPPLPDARLPRIVRGLL